MNNVVCVSRNIPTLFPVVRTSAYFRGNFNRSKLSITKDASCSKMGINYYYIIQYYGNNSRERHSLQLSHNHLYMILVCK